MMTISNDNELQLARDKLGELDKEIDDELVRNPRCLTHKRLALFKERATVKATIDEYQKRKERS